MNGKPLPVLNSDEEAERFVAEADLSEYDLSGGRWMRLRLQPPPGHERVSFNLPKADVEAALRRAESEGVDIELYLSRLVHESLEGIAS